MMTLKRMAFVSLMTFGFSNKLKDDLSSDLDVVYAAPHNNFSSKMVSKGFGTASSSLYRARMLRNRCFDDTVPLSKTITRLTPKEFEVVVACATSFTQLVKILERTCFSVGYVKKCRDVMFKALHRVNFNVQRRCDAILGSEFRVEVEDTLAFFRCTPRSFVIIKDSSRTTLRVVFYYGRECTFSIPHFDRTPSMLWTEDGRYLVLYPQEIVFDLAKLERIESVKNRPLGDVHPAFFISTCIMRSMIVENPPSFEDPIFVSRATIMPLMDVIISDPKMNKTMGWDLSMSKVKI